MYLRSELTEPTGTLPALNPTVVMAEQGRLINIAYRLLGSLADAEDAVQEGFTRWFSLSREQQEAIEVPGAWLTTVVSRICLDVLRSARVRRERYVGEWLPEPLPEATEWSGGRQAAAADPADRITLDESVDMAFLVVLDSMTPAERVTFLLHDVFRYPFAEIAEIVGRSPEACRQLARSARRRVRGAEAVGQPSADRADVVRSFKTAWESKDITALVGLLDPTASVIADGGGLVAAALHPVEGGALVADYLIDLAQRAGSLNLLERTVNGKAGLVAIHEGAIAGVYAFDISGPHIRRIWVVRNPEKLRVWDLG